jgi:hypothetical protein
VTKPHGYRPPLFRTLLTLPTTFHFQRKQHPLPLTPGCLPLLFSLLGMLFLQTFYMIDCFSAFWSQPKCQPPLSLSLQLFLPSFLVIHYYVEFYFLCNTNIRDDLTAYVFIVFPLPLIQSCFESYSADTGTMLRVLPTQLVFNLHLLNK